MIDFFVQIYYLDHLHHPASPENKYGTPCIKCFDNETIRDLARGDRRAPRQTGEPFGHAEVRYKHFFSCYADGKIPINANIYNLDLNSFVVVQRHVMSLHQNGRFLTYSTYMCHA